MTPQTSESPHETRDRYRHLSRIDTRWMDNDAYGHVNNVVYYSFFDTAVNRWLIERGVLDIATSSAIGLVVETQCRYVAPITFPDVVTAGIRVAHLGSSSVRYEIGLFRNDEAEAAATGHFVHVYVDRATRKVTPIPDAVRAALEILRALSLLFLLAACRAASPQGPAQRSPTPASNSTGVRAETVASGLVHPWALEFLPDGRMLVTERPGRLRIVTRDGALSPPVTGVPAVFAQSQGGLLDVALDPQFATNQLVYLAYSEPGPDGTAGTSVARGRLVGNALENVKVIYQQFPKVRSGGHFGSRLEFDRAGYLFITQGERQRFADSSQSLTAGMGKIMRIFPDGRVPPDNPFIGRTGARPEIWSYGHRNVQGATLDPATGRLWTIEHGARGGDELNHPEAGKNYGWPVITYGIDYSGMKIGEGSAKAGMEQPVYYWDPVIAPSGMTFYTSDAIPGWKGSLLIGSMSPGALVRLEMKDGVVTKEERYLGDLRERIRDVKQGPDGFVYVVTDNSQGRVLRVRP